MYRLLNFRLSVFMLTGFFLACPQTTFGFQQAYGGDPSGLPESSQSLIPRNISNFRSITQSSFYYKELRTKVDASFQNTSLQDVASWVQKQSGMTVFLDEPTLEQIEILPNQPITEIGKQVPIFQFLDRLKTYNIGWYVEDKVIVITSLDASLRYRYNIPYNVGKMYDNGIGQKKLIRSLLLAMGIKSEGGFTKMGADIEGLGDILFVKTTYRGHLQAQAILEAIRDPKPRTMVFEPAGNSIIRKKLLEKFDINLKDKSLPEFTKTLQEISGLTIRIDEKSLKKSSIQLHRSFRLRLEKKRLHFILGSGLSRLGLTWTMKDGMIWITTQRTAQKEKKIAVFQVGDLALNDQEAENLRYAIYAQSSLSSGDSSIRFVSRKLMIVRETESKISEVNTLLENYRIAIKSSKVRRPAQNENDKVVVCYYRMPKAMASDMLTYLKAHYKPSIWGRPFELDKNGKPKGKKAAILTIASVPGIPMDEHEDEDQDRSTSFANKPVEYSTLIITHRLSDQQEIQKIITNTLYGKPAEDFVVPELSDQSNGGGGFGGGGGAFRVPSKR